MRTKGEDDQAHTDTSDNLASNHAVRARFEEPATAWFGKISPEQERIHIRAINGEPLPVAVPASLNEGAQADAAGRAGASEQFDPIDAVVAVTSDYGLKDGGVWEIHPDQMGHAPAGTRAQVQRSPNVEVYDGFVVKAAHKIDNVQASLNQGKPETQQTEKIMNVYDCVGPGASFLKNKGKVLVQRAETPDESRLRWQHSNGPRSFHGAIIGGIANHRQVTAYDMAIGGGTAASDPEFYAYLCAVADWRLQQGKQTRPSIMKWEKFLSDFNDYLKVEPPWRRELIVGNADYYSTGMLPDCVPTLMEGLPSSVVCETLERSSFQRPPPKPAAAPGAGAKAGKSNKGGA